MLVRPFVSRVCACMKVKKNRDGLFKVRSLDFLLESQEETRKPLVKAISWPEDRRFVSRLGHVFFNGPNPFKVHYGPVTESASNRKLLQIIFRE
jgi:hypothetical protein